MSGSSVPSKVLGDCRATFRLGEPPFPCGIRVGSSSDRPGGGTLTPAKCWVSGPLLGTVLCLWPLSQRSAGDSGHGMGLLSPTKRLPRSGGGRGVGAAGGGDPPNTRISPRRFGEKGRRDRAKAGLGGPTVHQLGLPGTVWWVPLGLDPVALGPSCRSVVVTAARAPKLGVVGGPRPPPPGPQPAPARLSPQCWCCRRLCVVLRVFRLHVSCVALPQKLS